MKRKLKDVTLIGIDCVDLDRLALAIDICQQDFEFAEVRMLTSLPAKGQRNVVQIKAINSLEDYSRFIITELDDYLETTYVLLVQHDGFILNPAAWTDDFLNYDYIGAPWLVVDWSVEDFGFPPDLLGKWVVVNGGFSLRSKKFTSTCARLAKDGVFKEYHPEDVVLCVKNRKILEDHRIKFAPVELAKQFSFEGQDKDNYQWDGQFGFHGLNWTDISKW